MIRNPIDIASRVSPELSTLITRLIEQLESDEPLTLAAVRSFIAHELPTEIYETEQLHHFDYGESLSDELDLLIEGFGESAAAIDFVYAYASEALSRVIEAIAYDENRENPPTLETLREYIVTGLGCSLVGDGVLDEDEDDMLLPEIEALIERFGSDSFAEEFLRYE